MCDNYNIHPNNILLHRLHVHILNIILDAGILTDYYSALLLCTSR